MITLRRVGAATALALLTLTLNSCTGGEETTASTDTTDGAVAPKSAEQQRVDAQKAISGINPNIPIYPGVEYRADLSERDETLVKNQYGPQTQVYTLASQDSFPQVWHYYVHYLAQYRSYDPPSPYPPGSKNWRTMQIDLNQAMQDPFIPGEALQSPNRQVILQVAETEAEPPTVIRYIVTTPQATAVATTQAGGGEPVAMPDGPGGNAGEEP